MIIKKNYLYILHLNWLIYYIKMFANTLKIKILNVIHFTWVQTVTLRSSKTVTCIIQNSDFNSLNTLYKNGTDVLK